VRYRLRDGTETDEFPAHQSDFHHCRPVYDVLPGWQESLDAVEQLVDLPPAARRYVEFVESELGVEVALVGTGRERERVLTREAAALSRR
jgi:adenylosuccinate synthase